METLNHLAGSLAYALACQSMCLACPGMPMQMPRHAKACAGHVGISLGVPKRIGTGMPRKEKAYAWTCQGTCLARPKNMPRHSKAHALACPGICIAMPKHIICPGMPKPVPWHGAAYALAFPGICLAMSKHVPRHMPCHARKLISCMPGQGGPVNGGGTEGSQKT
mgnify:CR=1 FL=1|jgi:hypothetical protein